MKAIEGKGTIFNSDLLVFIVTFSPLGTQQMQDCNLEVNKHLAVFYGAIGQWANDGAPTQLVINGAAMPSGAIVTDKWPRHDVGGGHNLNWLRKFGLFTFCPFAMENRIVYAHHSPSCPNTQKQQVPEALF